MKIQKIVFSCMVLLVSFFQFSYNMGKKPGIIYLKKDDLIKRIDDLLQELLLAENITDEQKRKVYFNILYIGLEKLIREFYGFKESEVFLKKLSGIYKNFVNEDDFKTKIEHLENKLKFDRKDFLEGLKRDIEFKLDTFEEAIEEKKNIDSLNFEKTAQWISELERYDKEGDNYKQRFEKIALYKKYQDQVFVEFMDALKKKDKDKAFSFIVMSKISILDAIDLCFNLILGKQITIKQVPEDLLGGVLIRASEENNEIILNEIMGKKKLRKSIFWHSIAIALEKAFEKNYPKIISKLKEYIAEEKDSPSISFSEMVENKDKGFVIESRPYDIKNYLLKFSKLIKAAADNDKKAASKKNLKFLFEKRDKEDILDAVTIAAYSYSKEELKYITDFLEKDEEIDAKEIESALEVPEKKPVTYQQIIDTILEKGNISESLLRKYILERIKARIIARHKSTSKNWHWFYEKKPRVNDLVSGVFYVFNIHSYTPSLGGMYFPISRDIYINPQPFRLIKNPLMKFAAISFLFHALEHEITHAEQDRTEIFWKNFLHKKYQGEPFKIGKVFIDENEIRRIIVETNAELEATAVVENPCLFAAINAVVNNLTFGDSTLFKTVNYEEKAIFRIPFRTWLSGYLTPHAQRRAVQEQCAAVLEIIGKKSKGNKIDFTQQDFLINKDLQSALRGKFYPKLLSALQDAIIKYLQENPEQIINLRLISPFFLFTKENRFIMLGEKKDKDGVLSKIYYNVIMGDLGNLDTIVNENNVDKQDILGMTPLHYARLFAHDKIEKLLKKKGASVKIKNLAKKTAAKLSEDLTSEQFMDFIVAHDLKKIKEFLEKKSLEEKTIKKALLYAVEHDQEYSVRDIEASLARKEEVLKVLQSIKDSKEIKFVIGDTVERYKEVLNVLAKVIRDAIKTKEFTPLNKAIEKYKVIFEELKDSGKIESPVELENFNNLFTRLYIKYGQEIRALEELVGAGDLDIIGKTIEEYKKTIENYKNSLEEYKKRSYLEIVKELLSKLLLKNDYIVDLVRKALHKGNIKVAMLIIKEKIKQLRGMDFEEISNILSEKKVNVVLPRSFLEMLQLQHEKFVKENPLEESGFRPIGLLED